MDVLWAVALVSELSPLLAHLRRPRLLSTRLCVGRVGDRTVAVLRCGVGPRRAAARTRSALQHIAPREVWSVGSCGGLSDPWTPGSVVTARSVVPPEGPPLPVVPVPGLPVVSVHTVRAPVFDPGRRDHLRARGGDVCEMEAAGVVEAVGGRATVRVLKVVSDLAGGEPDPALQGRKPVAMARFHVRVERLVRTRLVPRLLAGPPPAAPEPSAFR